MRESDLLAFEIGLKVGDPAAVMCSYNAVNGDYACENKYLLTDVLKKDWNFKNFVLSDWGGTHSAVKASAAGLDNEEPEDLFYGAKLKEAAQTGKVPMSEIDDHARRVLRAEFAAGLVDFPIQKSVVDVLGGLETAQRIEESSIVLLKNEHNVLPLDPAKVHSIAVFGMNADTGMISGGGSAQVDPPGRPSAGWQAHVWFPTSPLKAIAAKAPGATVRYGGSEPAAAAEAAKGADVAIVFAYQWESEGMDLPDLALPDNQDALIEQVAAANPHTVVVLETGTAVTMPWLEKVDGVVEAWYAGSSGAKALANVLFGDVNPSGKLPMTFPRSIADLPHPHLVTPPPGATGKEAVQKTGEAKPTFRVHYDEGVKVGYKWYDAEHKPVLFPFGHGLSYTSYRYSGLKLGDGNDHSVTFTVTNSGDRTGAEIAEVYAALPASAEEPPKRLVGWARVSLKPGESREVTVAIDPKYLSIYDEQRGWTLLPGQYTFLVGGSSQDLPLKQETTLK
jgi:beta-glucosidase